MNINKEKLINNNKKLSIQLSLDGFSFCVYNNSLNKYEHVVSIPFTSKANTPVHLLDEVKFIFEDNILLHDNYQEILLIHHNELQTFVPKDYFSEDILSTYLKNTVKVFNNDFVSYDELNDLEMNNVYIPFVNINNYIFDSFGEFTYLHSATVFLQNILKANNVYKKSMYINVYANDFQLMVIENNELLLSNSFTYHTKEDFVYYILFVAEQLKMDPNSFSLTLYGEIKETDKEYELLYNYIRNVEIYAKLNALNKNSTELPQKNYNLLQLHL